MKKYNLSNIMKRAWELVKKAAMTMSAALRQTWKEAKEIVEKIKFTGRAKIAKIENGGVNPYLGTEYDHDCNYYTFNLWERGSMKRIYINDYKRRSVGYIDVLTRQVVSDKHDAWETAQSFMEAYEF